MLVDDAYTRFVTMPAKLSTLISADTLHWDGTRTISRRAECTAVSEPVAPEPLGTDPGSRSAVPTRNRGLLPAPPAFETDWLTEAAQLTFYLDLGLLLPPVQNVNSGATGTLIWVHDKREETCIAPTMHAALLVHTAYESLHVQYAEVIPHLPRHDPLLHHMALVLRAAVEVDGVTGRLYAEVLANALAAHLLSRYASGRHLEPPFHGGLTPRKLHRTIAYILGHLEHKLSLAKLAAVAQMSPAHFARLFKCATGQTPRQYVITCRMDQAKQLLATTDLSLSEISLQVGCADQSHFTALFRKYVFTTPKAYRDTAMSTFL